MIKKRVSVAVLTSIMMATSVVASDYNNDGYADILFKTKLGDTKAWFMSRTAQLGQINVAGKLETATVVGEGDFNKDSYRDMVAKNIDGSYDLWIMGATGKTKQFLSGNKGWTLAGTGDFDGDGTTDLLWRKADGSLLAWYMDGGARSVSKLISGVAAYASVEGIADMDNDGKEDIVVRKVNGNLVYFTIDRTGKTGSTFVSKESSETVVGLGDFDGNGYGDLLVRKSDGSTIIWYMGAAGKIGNFLVLGMAKSDWTAQDVEDYNNDGFADVLFTKGNGDVLVWFMNAGGILGKLNVTLDNGWTFLPKQEINPGLFTFSTDFETNSFEGWTAVSYGSTNDWEIAHYGSYVAKVTGYQDTVDVSNDWLVSPKLAFVNEPTLSFMHVLNYPGSTCKVLVSTDYDGKGDPGSATWDEITRYTASMGGWTFVDAGDFNLSAYEGHSGYIAFQHTNSSPNYSGTWELDDIEFSNVEETGGSSGGDSNSTGDSNLSAELQTYYQDAIGETGETLKAALHTILLNSHQYRTYSEAYVDLMTIDDDNSGYGRVKLFYSKESILATDRCGHTSASVCWNREHTWPKSLGVGYSESVACYTDLHHLRPTYETVNSDRGNRTFGEGGTSYSRIPGFYYDNTEWTWEVSDDLKGDVARIVFYMAVRYEGTNGEPDLELYKDQVTVAELCMMVAWNAIDPVSNEEKERNDLVETYQHNRNPFVDNNTWVNDIWGNTCNE